MPDVPAEIPAPALIKAVICDLGGVLLRTVDPQPRQQLAARLGLSLHDLYHQIFSSESARLATLGKIGTAEHWEQVRLHFGLSNEEVTRTIQQFWGGDQLDYSLVNYLRSLRPRYKTALLSNAWDNLRGLLESEWKIASAFDEVIISAEVGLAKPDHRIFQLALDRLGVDPGEAVFVDDFDENIDGARWLGLHTVQFRSREQTIAELARYLDQGRKTKDG